MAEEQDLSAIIASEIRQAESYDRTELSGKRTRAIEYMRGEMNDTPPRPNGSKQTDRTFADTVAWTLPGIVSVFAASDKFVSYQQVKAESEDWARDATDFTNHSFWNEGNGYSVIYDVIYDALTLGNGIISSYWEPERIETKIFRNKSEMELAALIEEGWQGTGVQPKPGKPSMELVDDGMGDYVEVEVPTYTVKLGKVGKQGKICDKACKPENLLLNSTTTTIEEARFVAYYHDDKTRSDLMEMAQDYGWDKDVIANLPSHRRMWDTEVASARDADRQWSLNDAPTKAGDIIGLYECYIRVDKDGDGIAEMIQAWYAGDAGGAGALLSDEEYEEDIPYSDIRCYPVPHRFDADSVFDRTEDIQRVKTVLLRGMLDNSYAVGLPMLEVEAGTVENPDVLATRRFGATIYRKKGTMATSPIKDHVIPFVADKLQMAAAYMDEMISKRTGVSRTTMALDPEALQNQTATANENNRSAAYSQIELIARNCAEYGGFTKHFAKRLKKAILHQKVRQIPDKKADNGFRDINPEEWDPNMAVTVNTGLGTGSRDRDMAMLNMIMQGQMAMAIQLKEAGLTNKALEMIPKIRKTAVQLAESSGLHNPEDYYPEFTDEDLQAAMQQAAEAAKQPPIEIQIEQMKLEAQGQLEQQKAQTQAQVEQQKLMVSAEAEKLKAQGNAVKEQAQMQADLQVKAAERENNLVVEGQKIASAERIKLAELQFKREELAINVALEREKMAHDAQVQREGMANSAGIAAQNNEAKAKIAKAKPRPSA